MKSTESKTFLITAAVEKYLEKSLEIKDKNKILIAYSAGPDSTALLDILCKLSGKYSLDIICSYYNHKLRSDEELDAEIRIAEENCRSRNIRLVIGADSGGIDKDTAEMGEEAAARKHRHEYLNSLFDKEKCDYMAFGHNLDDQIETVVMRVFRGSGASGLRGIPDRHGNKLRPLIEVSKKDILEYLEENRIAFSIDKSNNEDNYLRNKIRNILMPVVHEIFPGCEKSVISLSEKMLMTEEYIIKETGERVIWTETEEGYFTDLENFFSQPEIIQLESLYSAADRINRNKNVRIPYTFLKPVLGKVNSKNSTVYLEGYGMRLFRTGKKLFFKSIESSEKQKSFAVGDESEKRIYPVSKNRYICIEEKQAADCDERDIWVAHESLIGNLLIRTREYGDTISLKGGRKKIKKLFNEMGIQQHHKDRIPLLCDNSEIIAVMGSAFGYKDRVAERIYADKSKNSKVITFRIRQV